MINPISLKVQKPFLRPAPAYQEYASDVLADQRYRLMSLAERGLWDTLRKECWVNHKIPSDISDLHKFLGLDVETLKSAFTDRVSSFFGVEDGYLVCPELVAYRDVVEVRRMRQSLGGSNGGKKTQSNNRFVKANLEAKVKPLRGDGSIRKDSSRRESSIEGEIDRQWVEDYDSKQGPFE